MPEMQLDIYGGEVTIPTSMSRWHPTQAQSLLLRLARREEGVTALQAGVVLHGRRRSLGIGTCGAGARGYGPTRKGCCPYASSDGWDALKRLKQRGVVEQRQPRGPYFAIVNDR